MSDKLRLLDLFSGIGGFSLGLERSGLCAPVAFCEIDPFCRRVLARHWPETPCHGDVTTREFEEGEADVICGGFPCQDLSLAGRRAGLAGPRSGLYRELVRAIRVVRPRVAIVENVAALRSDGLGEVLGDLAEGGACVEWDCVPASAVGAPHIRDRIWIVAHADGQGRSQPALSRHAERLRAGDGVEDICAADAAHADGEHGRRGERIARTDRTQVGDGAGAGNAGSDAADAAGQSLGDRRLSRLDGSVAAGAAADAADTRGVQGSKRHDASQERRRSDQAEQTGLGACGNGAADAAGERCGQGWPGRPPDSFARVRDEARRNAADPIGARLAFVGSAGQPGALWPDEPALQGMDDGLPDWMDRVAATGNAVVPQIPELIGRAIGAALGLAGAGT